MGEFGVDGEWGQRERESDRAVHQQHVCYSVCVCCRKVKQQTALWPKVLLTGKNVPLVTVSAHVAQLILKSIQRTVVHLEGTTNHEDRIIMIKGPLSYPCSDLYFLANSPVK